LVLSSFDYLGVSLEESQVDIQARLWKSYALGLQKADCGFRSWGDGLFYQRSDVERIVNEFNTNPQGGRERI